jgi:selenide,water dikinase
LPRSTDPNLLAGRHDDAAVYRLTEDLALVQTVDFITPVVDDPYDFGAVAAANALSDVYAVGGRPLLALNLVSYPVRTLPLGTLNRTLQGGAEKAAEAGVCIAGGHSVDLPVPVYGLAVTGTVDPRRMVGKGGGRAGDRLYLTKPLGSGALATAADRRLLGEEEVALLVRTMAQLNAGASRAMLAAGARAATDVTGFGLLGHLHELARESALAARLQAGAVPYLKGAVAAVARGAVCTGTRNNQSFAAGFTLWRAHPPREEQVLLCDAQTSGGLLIAVAPEDAGTLEEHLAREGVPGWPVGELTQGRPGAVEVV